MLDKIKNVISNTNFLFILGLSLIFLGLAFYVYNSYIAPKINPDYVPNDEFNSTNKKKTNYATIYLFSTDWCPYSKKVKPIWEKLKNELEKTNINDYFLNFVNIDGDKNKEELTKFETDTSKKIEGYPSIFIIKDNQIVEFEAKPDESTLKEFIHSVL
jgi:thiol-disulfide isomerase/thioredoxin